MVLSVILPVYNGEAYLKRCVESVEKALVRFDKLIDQPLGGEISEIILIDDGSLDGTPEVCKELLAQYDNIKLLTLEDEGVSVARNKGLTLSCGDYIAFVDADDVVDELIFSKLYTALKSNNAAIAGCSFYEWSDEKILSVGEQGIGSITKISGDEKDAEANDEVTCYTPSEYIASEILYGNSRCWSKIYDRRYITEFLKGLSIGEDMLFLADAVIKAEAYDKNDANVTICELKKYKGYGYYKNLNGAMNRPFTPKYMDQISCWELLRDRLTDSGLFNSDDEEGKAVLKKLNTNYLVSIVLTASKLSLLDKAARKEYKKEINTCHSKLKEALKKPHALDTGYKIKSGLFNLSPELYLSIYHKWKV